MLSLKRMLELGAQVVVDAPPDQVFSYVTDFDRHHEWLFGGGGMEPGLEKISEGPVGLGTTFRRVGWKWFGLFGWYPVDVVVTEYEPNERVVFERRALGRKSSGNTLSIRLEPEPVGGGTRVTVQREWVDSFPWWARPLLLLFLPVLAVLAPFYHRQIRRMGSRVKEYYETPAA
jgi:uncharacterized protein YndB with AHSA1/START domain